MQAVEAWKRCPKWGKIENQVKAGRNSSGSQRCKCKECGIYYTIDPKRHEYPEETRELAIKMYYGGISGRGVGKILGMNKSNVMNWIKKGHRGWKVQKLCRTFWRCWAGWAVLVCGAKRTNKDPWKPLCHNDGKPLSTADRRSFGEPGQIRTDDTEDGRWSSLGETILYGWILWVFGCGVSGKAYLYPA